MTISSTSNSLPVSQNSTIEQERLIRQMTDMLIDITLRLPSLMQEIQKMGEIPKMTINVDLKKELTKFPAPEESLERKLYEVCQAVVIAGYLDNLLYDQAHRLDPSRFSPRSS